MGHGQHRDDAVFLVDGLAQHAAGEVVVRPEGAVGQHHAFREPRGARGVVDECQLVGRLLLIVADVLLAEVFRELLAIEFVQVLAGIGQLVRTAHHQRVVGVVDDTFQSRHLLRVDDGGYVVADEEQLRLRVVDDVMYLFGIELMEYGHSYSPVGQRGYEGHCPLAGVASAEGYLVALCHTRVLKQYMQLLNLASYVVELQCLTLEVCQRVEVPVVDNRLFKQCVKTRYLFHSISFSYYLLLTTLLHTPHL